MKITLFLIFFSSLHLFAADSYSQLTRLTLHMEQVKIKDVLVEIESQSEFYFLYNGKLVDVDKTVNMHAENQLITDVLFQLFDNKDVAFRVIDRQIVLIPTSLQNDLDIAPTSRSQVISINGTVTDVANEPLIGVNVQVKGTTSGTVTDVNGRFSVAVPNRDAILVFSYLGFLSQEIVVSNQTSLNVRLIEDVSQLEEVVVIGYGVLKKKLVTGSTLQVAGGELLKMSTTNAFTALQGQSPGVTIVQSNGRPGAGYVVNIRGLGTNGESRPLYVVDGVVSGFDALNNMSISDIESIDILKDAASTAIYGARAANGVILVTTKQGQAGKTRITYDGYFGKQYMFRNPKLLNAQQYMNVIDEQRMNDGNLGFDWENQIGTRLYTDIKSGRWQGADWVDAFYIAGAPTMNHSFNLTGGNDVSKFSIGYSYTSTEGILGESAQSQFNRNTFRINTDHVLLKVRDFEAIKIGQTLNYSFNQTEGFSSGNFRSMLTANPLMPAYNEDGSYYVQADKDRDGWGFDGNFGNPIAAVALSSSGLNLSKNHRLNASVFVQIQPIKGLIFTSRYGYRMSASSRRTQDQKRQLSLQNWVTTETVNQNQSLGYDWTLDNTLSYTIDVNRHRADIVVGQSVERSGFGENVNAGGNNNIFDLGWDYAWVDNTKPTVLGDKTAGGSPMTPGAISSFFGRVTYNFKETYMATATLRADGSSNFARGNRWGYFPSISAGWVMSNESFMESSREILDFLKLRVSWGQNGNSAIRGFQYLTTFNFPNSAAYYFGTDKTTPTTGAIPGVLKNPDISWEKTEMTDLGFDATLFGSRLSINFSYYEKYTKDWLLQVPISGSWGYSAPNGNGGSVRNKGVELAFSWNDHVGQINYGMRVNGSFNKNKVENIDNEQGFIDGSLNVLTQGAFATARLEVGHPMGFFRMYKSDGIFQTQAEVDAYRNKAEGLIMPTARPGDVRFVDINGDGLINSDDITEVGCGWPIYQLGFSINLDYKGFDFMLTGTGAFGHHIAKSYRSFSDSPFQNYTTQVFERWTGPGTSNKWPRLTNGSHVNYTWMSDALFLEKADHVKVQNITLGYDFKKLFKLIPLGQLRAYVTGQNMFIISKYSGIDPEVGNGGGNDWVMGYDTGMYPAARTFLFGLQITF